MQLLTSYDGNSTNNFVFDLPNVSETIVYLPIVYCVKKLPNFIAYSYCFQLTFHLNPKPKVKPQNAVIGDVTSILFQQNAAAKKFFFYSLTLKFMKL